MIDVNWLTLHKARMLTAVDTDVVAYLNCISQTVELHDGDWIRSAKIEEKEPLVNELEYFIGTVGNQRSRIFEDDGRYVLKRACSDTVVPGRETGPGRGIDWLSRNRSFLWWIFCHLDIYLSNPMTG